MGAPSGTLPPWMQKRSDGTVQIGGAVPTASSGAPPGSVVVAGSGGAAPKAPQSAHIGLYDYGGGLIDPDTGQAYGQGQQNKFAHLRANEAFGASALQKTRAAPQADLTQANTDLTGARLGIIGGINRLNQAGDIGTQQQALADNYNRVIQGTAGPSLAELAMQRASGAEARRNMAMAAGVGGPGSVSALINAQNRNAVAQGELQQNLGVQRAIEVEQARQGLGNVLATQRGQTGAEAGAYGGLASTTAGLAQVGGGQALANAGLQAGQNALNQQGEQYYYGQGADWIRGQAGLNAGYAQNWNNYTVGQQSNANTRAIAQQQHEDNMLGAIAAGAATIGSGLLTAATGGAAAPLLVTSGAALGQQVASGTKAIKPVSTASSDIRAKTAIRPAGGEISAAFRGIAQANQSADAIRDADTPKFTPQSPFEPTSASSYLYKDPNSPGAEPGQHYGPMAHEFEQTPAGASVVRTMPDGTKGIDTPRLTMMSASEIGKLRREMDALLAEKAAQSEPKAPTAPKATAKETPVDSTWLGREVRALTSRAEPAPKPPSRGERQRQTDLMHRNAPRPYGYYESLDDAHATLKASNDRREAELFGRTRPPQQTVALPTPSRQVAAVPPTSYGYY